jgi:hypothetical protein
MRMRTSLILSSSVLSKLHFLHSSNHLICITEFKKIKSYQFAVLNYGITRTQNFMNELSFVIKLLEVYKSVLRMTVRKVM